MSKKVQTLIFSRTSSPGDVNGGNGWTRDAATGWAGSHNFQNDKVDETAASYRLRQFDPAQCVASSFETLTENFPAGVAAVACQPKEANAAKPVPELRHYRAELRVTGDEKAPRLEGHAAVFNQLSEDFGGWREKIAPGAFADALKGDVRALWNHDADLVLGRTSSGTLELREDDTGLAFGVALPDTSWVRDRLVSLKRGDVTGCSFGFWTENDSWETDGSGLKIRTILKIRELAEISPGVTFPAYPQTDVALRSLGLYQAEEASRKKPAGQPAGNVVLIDLHKRRLQLGAHDLSSR